MKLIPHIFGFLIGISILGSYGFTTLPEKANSRIKIEQKIPSAMVNFLPALVLFPLEKGSIHKGAIGENTTPPFVGHSYTGFKEALAYKESRGRYGIINTLGYMGKYQFGTGTLALLGKISNDLFLNSPELQERVFDANIARNKWVLRRELNRFPGTVINGILITESGMMAAAHLAGPGNVKKYLRSNGAYHVADAYGTTLQDYLINFAGYSVAAIDAQRRPKVMSR